MIRLVSRALIIFSSPLSHRKSNMRVTLIHNPQAGDSERHSVDDFLAWIAAAGHTVTCHSAKGDHWHEGLDDPGDLVAVAGGDGTIGAVAGRLLGRRVPIAVLPLGTANNISKLFGAADAPHERLIAGWARARRIGFDVGVVRAPWGEARFIEGLGVGLFATAISQLDAREDVTFGRQETREESIKSALKWLNAQLSSCPATEMNITLDGNDLSGEYILMEAMNIQHIGPGLHFAPDAHPGDGMLDLFLVNGGERDELGEYLVNRLEGHSHPIRWKVPRGRHLQLSWENADMHIDDKIWPEPGSTVAGPLIVLDVKVESHALEFLLG
jgi:diacylglycerol kinase family enzyme